jgi:hypothetical protein
MITIGLLLAQTTFVGHLNTWELYTIWLSQIVSWPMWLSQIAQSFWGTNKMNRIVSISIRRCVNSRSRKLQKLPERSRGKKI